ncbi:MAG: Hsp20/alpha crystallin family protein [Bacteroidia bacterium]
MKTPIKSNESFFPTNWEDFFDTTRFFSTPWIREFREITMPAVNIREDEKSFLIDFAAPGFDKEDFKIKVENDQMTVSAEKKKSEDEKKENYTRKEFSYKSFSRVFQLPGHVEKDGIVAKYEKGILNLTVPKVQEKPKSPQKEISVQ